MQSTGVQLDQQYMSQLTKIVGEAKHIDKKVSKTVAYENSFVSNIPVVRDLYAKAKGIQPISQLQRQLSGSIDSLISSTKKLGVQIRHEENRIGQFEDFLDHAREQNLGTKAFMEYVEKHTDLDLGGGEFKDMMVDLEEKTGSAEAESQSWYDWMDSHIQNSKKYVTLMQGLGVTTVNWVRNSTKTYADVALMGEGMKLIGTTLNKLSDTDNAVGTVQDMISNYANEYAVAVTNLLNAYTETRKRLSELPNEQIDNNIKKLTQEMSNLGNYEGRNELNAGQKQASISEKT